MEDSEKARLQEEIAAIEMNYEDVKKLAEEKEMEMRKEFQVIFNAVSTNELLSVFIFVPRARFGFCYARNVFNIGRLAIFAQMDDFPRFQNIGRLFTLKK